jgi:hypothetical protein
MTRMKIPRDEWVTFFDRFSLQHEDWLASLFLIEPNGSKRIVAQDLALQAIRADLKSDSPDTISIVLANSRRKLLTHNQPHVQRVWLGQDPVGAHTGVELQVADGTRVILEFRSPTLPETVDGVIGNIVNTGIN